MEQDILIYIDDKERLDASVAANSFAHKDVKNRAYINTLGAELAMKYLVSENVDISNAKNIHAIKKILEETDIADIMLENIHIDVRVVFDENVIFIPKSHFEYNLTPDIYLVFNLSQDREFVKFLGFFEPKLINKNNANSEYYFIEKEKLSPAIDLVNYINSHRGNTDIELSDEEFETSERFIVSMSDNDISEADKKYLLKQLTKSAELRDRFIEYENFETLSYKTMNDPSIEKKEPAVVEAFTETEETLDLEGLEELSLDEPETIEELPVEEEPEPQEDLPADVVSFDEELPSLTEEPLAIEEIETPEEEAEETVDFEALDIPETMETFEEPLLDGISLDAIELPVEEEVQEEPVVEAISLDSIELPQEEETLIEEPVADMLSFDEIAPLEAEEPAITAPVEDVLSFDAIEPLQTEETPMFETQPEDILSLDGIIEPVQPEETPVVEEDILSLDTIGIMPEETESPMAFEDIQPSEVMPFEDNLPEPSEQEPPALDDIIESLPFEEPVENEDSSFGKNLLENLSAESDSDIEIEGINEYEQTDENISSSDLLSQIDDVLSSSSTADIPMDSIDDILNEADDLNVLYNEETPAEEQPAMPEPEEQLPTAPGAAVYNAKKPADKKSLLTAGALIAVLAAASAFYFLKPKDTTADIDPLPVNNQAPAVPQQTNQEDILASNAPQAPVKKDIEATKPVVKELKNNPPKPVKSESYLEVNRLVWDVPDALSYSSKIQNYLRTAGRSIKLSLSADLLLATEYAYTNQVKVGLTLSKNGSIQDAKILSGSGSTQIDNIVLQSVKDTLNVVKPPADEIKTPDFNLNLIIYF